MKKTYITPNAEHILLDAEYAMAQLITGSINKDPEKAVEGDDAMSNRRSSSIWNE